MINIIKSSAAPTDLFFLTATQIRDLIREELIRALRHAPQEERLLNIEEAAKVLSVSPDWLYRHAKHLPFSRRSGSKMLRFSHDGIMKWLSTRR